VNAKSPRGFRARIRKLLHLEDISPFVRRMIVGVIGGTILLIGVAMIVLPGPAVVVIPIGLAVLATEFVWARRWLRKARKLFKKAKASVSGVAKKNDSAHDGR
jgi:tellurite resistance protein TerC